LCCAEETATHPNDSTVRRGCGAGGVLDKAIAHPKVSAANGVSAQALKERTKSTDILIEIVDDVSLRQLPSIIVMTTVSIQYAIITVHKPLKKQNCTVVHRGTQVTP
jgi:hypothetical protein